ncbi:MAG: dicarboxylate/amino acid:cation symporter, partial [Dysosmobacter sp.]|nr:dicarboxylate/amino acid:cation symporter [Dysosmobacter sp.]
MATQTGKQSLWQQYKTPILLLGGIAIGSLIGVISPGLGQTLKPLGDIFLNLLFTIVVPLVFVSIACAVGCMANMARLGRILGGTVAVFLSTGAVAAACVLVWVNLFSPSAGTNIQLAAAEVGEAQTAAQMIVGSLTVSDFPELWSKSHMLPLIIFAIITGFCVASCGGESSPVGKLLANLNDIIMKFVGVIMTIAPVGLGAYFANLIGEFGPQLLSDYGRSMVVYYPLCLLYVLIFYPLYALFAGGKTGLTRMLKH